MTKPPKEPTKIPTIEEQRQKLRNQLLLEFEQGGNEEQQPHVSKGSLCKRASFLKKLKKWKEIDPDMTILKEGRYK